jgi:hypothetical protein
MANLIVTTHYKGFEILPIERAGKTRFSVIDAAGATIREGLWSERFAQQAIDTRIIRAAMDTQPAPTTPLPATTAERYAANARKLGRCENNASDLV